MTSGGELQICLAASAGGHLTQLLRIMRACQMRGDFVVTTSDVVRESLSGFGRVYVVGECNREHPLRVVSAAIQCARILRQEKPGVVISTGAAPACLLCLLAKLQGAKVIWVDSITNVKRLSLSGRIIRHVSDLFLVQWPELAEQYSGVEYVGVVM
jgi:UDP-N-acetylglucosamine:LPS N-acetylglucosamine transferase